MDTVRIELNRELMTVLEGVAAAEQRSAQEICREAVEEYLHRHEPPVADRSSPLRRMIGFIKEGPTDTSKSHDRRDGDDR